MTHIDFNHLLSSLDALSPAQARQLRQQLDRRLAQPTKLAGKVAKRARSAPSQAKKALTLDEIHRQMLASGLLTSLPDPALDIDDNDADDQPVPIKGEPLSETILRERR